MTAMMKDLVRLAQETRVHSRKMQHRLLQYWCSMALVLFGVLLVILSMTGILSRSEKELRQALEIHQSNVAANLTSHLDLLEAQAIALSEHDRTLLKDRLYAKSVDTLNDDPDQLLQLQQDLYGPLNTTLKVSPCSGAFSMVDATTNTEAPQADHSRSGLYLRFVNISTTQSANQEVTFFRGVPQVAREAGIRLHNRWNLEFDTEKFPGYDRVVAEAPARLADACLWMPRINLPDTWEEVMYLSVPILDGNGSIAGLCGVELSSLYFRLTYPSLDSEFGPMITLLAPLEYDSLLVDQGLIGDTSGTLVDFLDTLQIEEGKNYNTYTCHDVRYVGVHTPMQSVTVYGTPLAAVTLIPAEGVSAVINRERTAWVVGAMLFLLVMVVLSIYLSKGFVKPILKALESIRNMDWEEGKSVSYLEIDDLFDFLAQKDQEHDETLRQLEQQRQEAQNRADTVQSQYTQARNDYELAQAKLEKLASRSPQSVDGEDYQMFLNGLYTLTPTERGIFDLYLSGHSAKEILELLSIKENTLKYHNRNIYSKLGVSSRKQLLQYAQLMRQRGDDPQH